MYGERLQPRGRRPVRAQSAFTPRRSPSVTSSGTSSPLTTARSIQSPTTCPSARGLVPPGTPIQEGIQNGTPPTGQTARRRPFSSAAFHQSDARHVLSRPSSRVKTAWEQDPPTPDDDEPPRPTGNYNRSKSAPPTRSSSITRAVNQVRALTANAKRMRNMTPSQALLMTQTMTSKQREKRDRLESVDVQRRRLMEAKVKEFYERFPLKYR